jgi:hypothetical protein
MVICLKALGALSACLGLITIVCLLFGSAAEGLVTQTVGSLPVVAFGQTPQQRQPSDP